MVSSFKARCLAAASVLSLATASPCPYGQLAERGELPQAEANKFFASRSLGEAVPKEMMANVQKREFAKQADLYKRQQDAGELDLGGGLLNGVLQPFTGLLADLDVPDVQEFSLELIPDAAHPYVAPLSTAVRGMCPTLNTMANHGYISRDGITTFAEAANACQITLGFGYDTCVFLSALGLISGGDLVSGKYSIGGEDSRVPNTLGPSLGASHHGPFEIDTSISRQDTYFGNNANFEFNRWGRLVQLADKYDGFGAEMWAQERAITYEESLTTNPDFDAGAKWLAVSLAERAFIYRALPNGTAEDVADYQNIAPFYLNETFPDYWYRRSTAYGLADLGVDIADLIVATPILTTPGQNQGLNNFVPLGLDLADFTPDYATCFLGITIMDLVPGSIAPVTSELYQAVTGIINGAIKPFFSTPTCDFSLYTSSGGIAGNSTGVTDTAGVSTTCNVLVNGVYEC